MTTRMPPPVRPDRDARRTLRTGIVIAGTEDICTVVTAGRTQDIGYARPFPRPRAERVSPGHLVAIAQPRETPLVLWRWFDAVVLDTAGDLVELWEPHHGTVSATPRGPRRQYLPGSRAYLSAGLPGAAWWVEGPAVDAPEHSRVDLDAVAAFFTELGLWDEIGQT